MYNWDVTSSFIFLVCFIGSIIGLPLLIGYLIIKAKSRDSIGLGELNGR